MLAILLASLLLLVLIARDISRELLASLFYYLVLPLLFAASAWIFYSWRF